MDHIFIVDSQIENRNSGIKMENHWIISCDLEQDTIPLEYGFIF